MLFYAGNVVPKIQVKNENISAIEDKLLRPPPRDHRPVGEKIMTAKRWTMQSGAVHQQTIQQNCDSKKWQSSHPSHAATKRKKEFPRPHLQYHAHGLRGKLDCACHDQERLYHALCVHVDDAPVLHVDAHPNPPLGVGSSS